MTRKVVSRKPRAKPWRIEWKAVTTADVLQIKPEHKLWKKAGGKRRIFPTIEKGTLVRVQPPAGAPPDYVEALRLSLLKQGASTVKVLPPAPDDVVQVIKNQPVEQLSHRAVVMKLGEDVASHDPAALMGLLNAAMDHAEAGG